MQSNGEPKLDKMALKVKSLFKFKHLYDQMDFNPDQRLAITKSIKELTDPLENHGLIKSRSRRNSKFKDGVVAFYDHDTTSRVATIALYTAVRV